MQTDSRKLDNYINSMSFNFALNMNVFPKVNVIKIIVNHIITYRIQKISFFRLTLLVYIILLRFQIQ